MMNIKSITRDFFQSDGWLCTPCDHPEVQLTLIDGSLVMHCCESTIVGGECRIAVGLRIPSLVALSIIQAAETHPEKDYALAIHCGACNEGKSPAEHLRDLSVRFVHEKGVLEILCESCGKAVGTIPLEKLENIN